MNAFWLPYPPTVNNLFLNVGKRRVRTKAYDAWISEAQAALLQQRPSKVVGPYRITIVAHRPDKRRRDLANLEKATSDILVKAGVIADDCDAERILMCWSKAPAPKPPTILVKLTPEPK